MLYGMLGIFKKIFGKTKPGAAAAAASDPARYEQEKKIAHGDDAKKRLGLARNTRTHQEILYYMAEHDPDAHVRRAVAKNVSTPLQAVRVLAADIDVDVRLTLAQRLVALLPELSKDEHSQLYAYAVQALGTLALDEVLKIRLALSSALKDKAYTPPKVASRLARDLERQVSEPILRFCTALMDEELLDILETHPADWAAQAIARRKNISSVLAEAVIAHDDPVAGRYLLENEGADITESLLGEIIEKARFYPEWQKPVAVRKNLPPGIARALAEFADMSVRDILAARQDFDEDTIADVSTVFQRRLAFAAEEEQHEEKADQRLSRLEQEGRLDQETLSDAIAMRDYDLAFAALARMAGTNAETVEALFEVKAPKSIVALCWQAGLSMRMALYIQQELAHVPHKELIYPREGTDYPLAEDEIRWQLDFLGIKPL